MPQKVDRTQRLAEQIRRELAALVGENISHPHASFLSITAVRITRDLSYGKVYITHIIQDEKERAELLRLLNAKAKTFQNQLFKKLTIRKIPELTFLYDNSVEYGAKMEVLLSNLVKKEDDE